ncbi:helix-turn-helix domain-containing protein [Phenylobacterium sp. 58.2.17]|uniref:helix-turn-helix domain-containing protein n=1 Tax=Phenylobacterium sp. 58.2.17 TaxID=2969306 RepID=UPI0022643AA6|nr:helix-turn-helix transcriptional regulator [Phenylobacterium sp. 58.2.17]MCX7586363.1 helix-turn-helix transcriptional regulator [Phenylobacterium sp. 58.2.17]
MDDAAFPSHSALLATALRAIRRARGMRSSEVAEAMGLQLRTYQHFEEGAGPFDLDRIRRFADATDSDPFAIVASIWLQDADFAVRAIEAKPMVVMMLALRSFHEELDQDITLIEPRVWWGGFRRLFQDLADHVRKQDLSAETWLDDQALRLGLPPSFHPRSRRKPSDEDSGE